jgi:hypothetical protein
MSVQHPFPVLHDPGNSFELPAPAKLDDCGYSAEECEQAGDCNNGRCKIERYLNHWHTNRSASCRCLNSATISVPSETAHQPVWGNPAHIPGTSTVKLPPGGLPRRRAAASTTDKGSIGAPGVGHDELCNGAVRRLSILNLRCDPNSGAVAREPLRPCPPAPRKGLSGALFARHCHSAAAAARRSRGKRAGPHPSVERT